MSSKSRKQNQPQRPAKSVAAPGVPTLEDFEEAIHVPEGRSRGQFLLLIGLMIFLLVIFIIPGAFQNTFNREGGGEAEVAFTIDGAVQEVDSQAFYSLKQTEDTWRRLVNPYMNSTPSDEEMATNLLLDALAERAGVRVSKNDLADALRGFAEGMGGSQAYKATIAARFRGGVPAFEEYVRTFLRRGRYLDLMARLAVDADPAEVEARWNEQHVLDAYEYIETPRDAYLDDALAEAPSDETLEAWFDGRPEYLRNMYLTQERYALGAAFWRPGDAAPEALLAAYPVPEADDNGEGGWDEEEAARTYYQNHSHPRFLLDEPLVDENGDETRYLSADEALETCKLEARVLHALSGWRLDLQARFDAGEELDLAAEAQAMGLGWHETPEALDRDAIGEYPEFGSGSLKTRVGGRAAGDLLGAPLVSSKVLEVVRVLSVEEPAMPPFEDIREPVLESWSQERAGELAVERLEALRGEAESLTAEEFAALAAGDEDLVLGLRGWFDRAGSPAEDPDAAEPAHSFLRSQAFTLGLHDLAEGGLSAPALSAQRNHAYLVRSLGTRPMDFSMATPGQVEGLHRTLESEARAALVAAFSPPVSEEEEALPPYLVATYGLRLPRAEAARLAEAAKEAAESEAADA